MHPLRSSLTYAVLSTALLATTAAHAATVAGNLAGWVANAPNTGATPDDHRTMIAVHMRLQNIAHLKQLVTDVSTPGSARYGHYLTPAEFRAEYAPAATDVAAVQAMLTKAGMQDITVGPMGTYVTATATVAQMRRTFHVTQNRYRYGTRSIRSNAELPTIPDALAGKIVYIEGLDETGVLRHPFHESATQGVLKSPDLAAFQATPKVTPPPVADNLPSPYCDTYFGDLNATLGTKPGPYAKTLPWLNCGYTPQQIQAAYGINHTRFDGSGIKVAIVDAYASPTLKADGNRFSANHNLPPLTAANYKQIIPDGIYNVNPDEPCGPYGWWGEQALDVAAVHGSAPGATIVFVGARDCETSLSVALENTIYNEQADIITNSYGENGEADSAADIAMQDQAFMTAAADGITVLFSSGDDGDLSQDNGVASGSYEATSPYVTGVGGTSLAIYNAAGAKEEYGWGNYRDYLADAQVTSGTAIATTGLTTLKYTGGTRPVSYYAFAFYAGSGGGISIIEDEPDYQKGVVPHALATELNYGSGYTVPLPTPHRVTPDVAMDADPYTGYLSGESMTIAGNPVSDAGCTPTTGHQEYCESGSGGTSLASPLMAGVFAIADQARGTRGKPMVGFANPLLYATVKLTGSSATLKSAAINDVTAPTSPVAVLRGYANDLTRVRVVTINSVPTLYNGGQFLLTVCSKPICEGIDETFNFVTPGYDDVTGLGVPYVPNLIK